MNDPTTDGGDQGGTDEEYRERERECEWCGRERPENVERFTVAYQDFSPATAAYDKFLFCKQCWKQERDRTERGTS